MATVLTAVAAFAQGDQRKPLTVSLKPGDNALAVVVSLGTETATGKISVNLDDGRKIFITARIEPEKLRQKVVRDGKESWEEKILPDAIINFSGLVRYYSRPRMQRYTANQQEDLVKRWDTLPAASKRFVNFETRQDAAGVAFYLDGLYVGRRDAPGKLESLTVIFPEEATVRNPISFTHTEDPKYLPLDVKSIAKPGVMREATVSLSPGLQTVQGIPIVVAEGATSVDVGVVKQMKGSWALECDEHLSRTALDGMPETAHFSVPRAWYTRAYALCAVEPSPEKDPIITARLTRFARSGRSEAISDTTLSLPRGDGPLPPGATKVGTIRYEQDGKAIELPLLLVEFKLKPGDILDLLSMDSDSHASMMKQPYLDFEFLGKLGRISAQWDTRHKPDNKSTSAVHVFGVTLAKSPVELRLDNGQPGNIFHNDEEPEMFATLKAIRACDVVFCRRIYDIDGHTVRQRRDVLRFEASGQETRIAIPLETSALGWYGIDFTMSDKEGRILLEHAASFAWLGNDTRKAGYDSPYGTWWFAGAHYGAGDKDIAGPMLFKAGLRKTTFGWSKYSEEDMAPWKITLNQISSRVAPRDRDNKETAYAEAEAKVKELRERFPHCRSALIFHESYAHYIPGELRDEKHVEDDAAVERARALVERGTFAAEFYREKFPDIKLLVGNTSSSVSIIAALLRHGFDPKHIDYIGVEAVGQTCMPEKLWDGGTQGIWLAREVARKFGHDLPVDGCYEFTARTDRTLGPHRHAEWVVRDILLCHAYEFKHINPAIIHDVGNAYFNTLWGAGGLCRRNPLLYPKPAYVAVATATKVLDQVTLLGRMETGSTTVYALEFRRADGKFAYALWTTRGEAQLRLQSAARADIILVDLYGKEKKVSIGQDRRLDVACSSAPVYVVSPAKIQSIDITDRSFGAPPGSFAMANRMDRIEQWQLQEGDMSLSNPSSRSLPIRTLGDFALIQVIDKEKGQCLELRLKKTEAVPDIVSEYAVMKLKSPAWVSGKPDRIGLWVRGDSGWGKIVFEIQDATGALWRTEGAYHDWSGDLSICHDGWRYMDFPIDGSSTERNISAGRRWNTNSPSKDAKIEFPIKIVGLYVVMNRKALDLSEMKDVEGVVRFRDIGASGGERGPQPVSRPAPETSPGRATADEPGKVHWREDFSRFSVGPAGGFGEKCVIKEEGGRKHLHGTGWLMGKMDYFGASQWRDCSFRFRFRFTDPKKIGFYPLVKSRGTRGDVSYLWYYVKFDRERLSFSCHGLPKELAGKQKTPTFRYEDFGLAPLEARTWYVTDIRATTNRIKVFLSKDGGAMTQIADVETVPGNGGVDILSYVPIDVADIVVEKLASDDK